MIRWNWTQVISTKHPICRRPWGTWSWAPGCIYLEAQAWRAWKVARGPQQMVYYSGTERSRSAGLSILFRMWPLHVSTFSCKAASQHLLLLPSFSSWLQLLPNFQASNFFSRHCSFLLLSCFTSVVFCFLSVFIIHSLFLSDHLSSLVMHRSTSFLAVAQLTLQLFHHYSSLPQPRIFLLSTICNYSLLFKIFECPFSFPLSLISNVHTTKVSVWFHSIVLSNFHLPSYDVYCLAAKGRFLRWNWMRCVLFTDTTGSALIVVDTLFSKVLSQHYWQLLNFATIYLLFWVRKRWKMQSPVWKR